MGQQVCRPSQRLAAVPSSPVTTLPLTVPLVHPSPTCGFGSEARVGLAAVTPHWGLGAAPAGPACGHVPGHQGQTFFYKSNIEVQFLTRGYFKLLLSVSKQLEVLVQNRTNTEKAADGPCPRAP